MKEITSDIREVIFMLYLECDLYVDPKEEGEKYGIFRLSLKKLYEGWQFRDYIHLYLTPLSEITDEDAIEVCKIMDFIIGHGLRFDRDEKRTAVYSAYNEDPLKKCTLFIFPDYEIFSLDDDGKVFMYDAFRISMATDYLRSKGYALPAFGYSVDQLIEQGIFKLKTPTPDGK